MKIRIFRPASGTRKTYSRYGMSKKTENTADKRLGPRLSGRFAVIVDDIQKMSADEFRKSLLAAGIIDKDGKLKPKYTTAK
jgi:hypothetical protein